MNTVEIAHECGCFKKSEYEAKKTFDNQQDAYNYSNVLAELMNEEFCSTHTFVSQKTEDDNFVIGVFANPNAGSCGTSDEDSGCGTSCGC